MVSGIIDRHNTEALGLNGPNSPEHGTCLRFSRSTFLYISLSGIRHAQMKEGAARGPTPAERAAAAGSGPKPGAFAQSLALCSAAAPTAVLALSADAPRSKVDADGLCGYTRARC
jgi:hypothetical protein